METAKQTIEWSTGPLEKSGRKQNNCNNQVKIKTNLSEYVGYNKGGPKREVHSYNSLHKTGPEKQ